MVDDRRIQEAIAIGEQNKAAIELVHNWCLHARVERTGGTGLVELQSGLPIGARSMACDHAPASGFSGMDLLGVALDFAERNCTNCDKRVVRGLPNLATALESNLKKREERRLALERGKQEQVRAHEAREQVRRLLANHLSPAGATLLQDLAQLDATQDDVVVERIIQTVKLAPEVLSGELRDYVFALAEAQEYWATKAAITVLDIAGADSCRLAAVLVSLLSRHCETRVAARLLPRYVQHLSEADIEAVLPALIHIASPSHRIPGVDRPPPDSGPLHCVFDQQPKKVLAAVMRMLDQPDAHALDDAARAVVALSWFDHTVPAHFGRGLFAKLARMHLVVEPSGSHEADDLVHHLQLAAAAAILARPGEMDRLAEQFIQGAKAEGEAHILGAYERALRWLRPDQAAHPNADQAVPVLIRRIVQCATTSSDYDVLHEVSGALHGEPDGFESLVGPSLVALLGGAAVMAQRIESTQTSRSVIAQTDDELQALNRANVGQQMTFLRDGMIRWAFAAARSRPAAIEEVISFINGLPEDQERTKYALISEIGRLSDADECLRLVLPTLYGAMLGASVLCRAAAAHALATVRRFEDLPDLVHEAFVLLLTDPYILVHQAAFKTAEKTSLPEKLELHFRGCVWHLLVAYRGKTDEAHFYVECLMTFLRRVADSDEQRSFALRLLAKAPIEKVAHEFRYAHEKEAVLPAFADLVLILLEHPRQFQYSSESLIRLLHQVPRLHVFERRAAIANVARSWSRFGDVGPVLVEVLSAAGAWAESVEVADCLCKALPEGASRLPQRLLTEQFLIAAQFELALATGSMDAATDTALRWRDNVHNLEEDRKQYAQIRDPLRGLLGSTGNG